MSLPYPDIDFVPLDVLLADELDQLQANILSLADGTGFSDRAIPEESLATGDEIWRQIGKVVTTEERSNVVASVDLAGVDYHEIKVTCAGQVSSTSANNMWLDLRTYDASGTVLPHSGQCIFAENLSAPATGALGSSGLIANVDGVSRQEGFRFEAESARYNAAQWRTWMVRAARYGAYKQWLFATRQSSAATVSRISLVTASAGVVEAGAVFEVFVKG